VNSTSTAEINHGQFIRQLKGSKVNGSGPLLTKYSSENFSLCYYCHAEEKVVGILPGYNNPPLHMNSNILVSEIGTNFRNMNGNGNGYYPTNIHWNHLDSYGSLPSDGLGMYDYDGNGIINGTYTSGPYDSYQSCPACHNVHGTNYPKMTKNDIAIAYGSDVNGAYGYIGSTNYSSPGGDLYCAQNCHFSNSTVYKYYRDEINIFKDCISCHADGLPGNHSIKDFNKTAFGQGVHQNINTTEGVNLTNNSDCSTCHFNIDMNRSNISRCENCHIGNGSSLAKNAPKISTHLPAVTNYSCNDCHSKVKSDPGLGFVDITSHYLKRPTISSVYYCDYCHGPNKSSPFNATNKTIPEFKHDDPLWDGTSTCRTCHTNSSVSADPKANDTSSFHNLTTELGDAYNGSIKADCILCHIQKDPQFVSAPGLPTSHPTVSGQVTTECDACHRSGSNTLPQQLHSVEPTGGGCVACHSNNASRYYVNISLFDRHANLNTTDGPNNVTDADCRICHFGAANITMSLNLGLGKANHSNTYFCEDCHNTSGIGPVKPNSTDLILIKNTFKHGKIDCKWCHIAGDPLPRPLNSALRYHPGGPKGTAKGNDCVNCHKGTNLWDIPFRAPGIVHGSDIASCLPSGCHTSSAQNHLVSYKNDNTPQSRPTISIPSVVSPVNAGNPARIETTVTDGKMKIAAAQYQITNGSVVLDWSNMSAKDGSFDNWNEIVIADIDTSKLSPGVYNVNVIGMSSAPRTNLSIPAYPWNGAYTDIKNAILTVTQPLGYVNGTVKNSSGIAIPDAIVTANTVFSVKTDANGNYSLNLVIGPYQLTASKEPEFYASGIVSVTVTTIPQNQDFILNEKPKGTISGKVSVI
jgi:hypothetical protein